MSAAGGPDDPSAPRRGRRRGRRAVRVAIVLLLIPVVYLGVTFVQVWRAAHHDGARPAQAAVVLGAAQYDGRPSPALEARLQHGLDLYRQGLVQLIVVTGGKQQGDRFTEATAGYNWLRARGVPDGDIRKEVQGHTTYESLAAVHRFLAAESKRNVLLVSGPAYSARLAGIAHDVGLDAAVSPAAGHPGLRTYVRETGAVALGRIIGYRRLERFDR